MKFNWEITVKVFSVIVTVAASVGAILHSRAQDRELARHEQANLVRNAAATTVANLNHWRDVSLSLFDVIQPVLIQTSQGDVPDAVELR